jgi:hypothetical protein
MLGFLASKSMNNCIEKVFEAKLMDFTDYFERRGDYISKMDDGLGFLNGGFPRPPKIVYFDIITRKQITKEEWDKCNELSEFKCK